MCVNIIRPEGAQACTSQITKHFLRPSRYNMALLFTKFYFVFYLQSKALNRVLNFSGAYSLPPILMRD